MERWGGGRGGGGGWAKMKLKRGFQYFDFNIFTVVFEELRITEY